MTRLCPASVVALAGLLASVGCTGEIDGADEGVVLATGTEAIVVGLGGNQLGVWPEVPALSHNSRLKPIARLEEGATVIIETSAQLATCVITQRGFCAVSLTDASGNVIHGVVQSKYLQSVTGGAGGGSTEFFLPWTAGSSYQVTQDHNTGSHNDGKDNWAWDFGLPENTAVLAAHDGRVRMVKGDSTVGGCSSTYTELANYVVLERLDASGNPDGIETVYMHLLRPEVAVGARVARGQEIGRSGHTGYACGHDGTVGSHLHFQVQQGPGAGGTTSYWNPTIHASFHEAPHDPLYPASPVSANVPR